MVVFGGLEFPGYWARQSRDCLRWLNVVRRQAVTLCFLGVYRPGIILVEIVLFRLRYSIIYLYGILPFGNVGDGCCVTENDW